MTDAPFPWGLLVFFGGMAVLGWAVALYERRERKKEWWRDWTKGTEQRSEDEAR